MSFEISKFQGVAANLAVGGETCDLAQAGAFSMQKKPDTEITPLLQKIEAMSIAEIDRLMAELQEVKSYLQSEKERIEQEMIRFKNLTQKAALTTKIIFDAVSQWHPACGKQISNASEVTAASAENNTSTFGKSLHHSRGDTSKLGQAAHATNGTQSRSNLST
jgi:hypothetical protein